MKILIKINIKKIFIISPTKLDLNREKLMKTKIQNPYMNKQKQRTKFIIIKKESEEFQMGLKHINVIMKDTKSNR